MESQTYAHEVAYACHAAGLSVRIVDLPDSVNNVSDYIGAGYRGNDLVVLIEAAPWFTGPLPTRLSEVTPEPVSWLWPGWIPVGSVIVLEGSANRRRLGRGVCSAASPSACGVGKTLLALDPAHARRRQARGHEGPRHGRGRVSGGPPGPTAAVSRSVPDGKPIGSTASTGEGGAHCHGVVLVVDQRWRRLEPHGIVGFSARADAGSWGSTCRCHGKQTHDDVLYREWIETSDRLSSRVLAFMAGRPHPPRLGPSAAVTATPSFRTSRIHTSDVLEHEHRAAEAKFVVVAPLLPVLSSAAASYTDQELRNALAKLARLAARTRTAILVTRDLDKGAAGNARDRGAGLGNVSGVWTRLIAGRARPAGKTSARTGSRPRAAVRSAADRIGSGHGGCRVPAVRDGRHRRRRSLDRLERAA